MSTAHADKELTFVLRSEVWGMEPVLKEIHIPRGADLRVMLNYWNFHGHMDKLIRKCL